MKQLEIPLFTLKSHVILWKSKNVEWCRGGGGDGKIRESIESYGDIELKR